MAHTGHKYGVSDDQQVVGPTPAGRMPRFFGKARLVTACLSSSRPVMLTTAAAHCFMCYTCLLLHGIHAVGICSRGSAGASVQQSRQELGTRGAR